MSKIKIIVHTMHETEQRAAERLIENPTVTDGCMIGEIDESKLAELRATNVIIEPITSSRDERTRPETPAAGAKPLAHGEFRTTAFSTRRAASSPGEIDLSRPNVYLIHIAGPLLEQWHAQLKSVDVDLMESYGADSYSAFLRPNQLDVVRALPFVVDLHLYTGVLSIPAGEEAVAPSAPPATSAGIAMVTYDIRLQRELDMVPVSAWLGQNHVSVSGKGKRKVRIFLLENSPLREQIASLPGVERIEEYVAPTLCNDRACAILEIRSQGRPLIGLDGAGQVIGIADTGLDDQHPDFAGRVTHIIARGRPTLTDDPNGHGTHVAGSASGSGAASNGLFSGAAPAAQLVFQSLLDSNDKLGGLPIDLNDLFDEAYSLGVRIHNNSWGAKTEATYTLNSVEVDEFVWSHPDMLIVLAAGNEGTEASGRNPKQGVVDLLSLGSPATAKNALTVGASRSDRTSGGYSTSTWGASWPQDFLNPPIANETISGDPQSLAAFSSRGPSDDRRVKPDVVAPGTDIISARSSKAPASHYWGLHSNPRYAYDGGTSMATPLVSGCAALVRQYYARDRGLANPSAALLRATLINGTKWLTGQDSVASNQMLGNYDQGFGCIDMSVTVPNASNPALVLAFVDGGAGFSATGEKRRWIVNVGTGGDLRICLAYTDFPARALQNNLNLFLQLPDGTKRIGNEGLPNSLKIPDVDNNVEVIRIPNALPGAYLIQVTARNILHGPQNFALVVTGSLQSNVLSTI
jgi:serine protease AprX